MPDRSSKAPEAAEAQRTARTLRVWDLPTRLFHWLLVALVTAAFVTAGIGGNLMHYHVRCGEAVLALVLFRTAWGVIGSAPSRFASFLAGPSALWRYGRAVFRRGPDAAGFLTHNPLGGWSVAVMLVALLFQAGTGLFADDDIATAGPLAHWVSAAASRRLTALHLWNRYVVIGLAAVHVAAVLFHLFFKREDLITPMITGDKPWTGGETGDLSQRPLWLAALAAAGAAGAVYLLVR
jgi:cytochrome b